MAEQEVIDTEHAEEVMEPVKETPKPSRADYDRIQAEKASKNGWKDFDAFVEEGGDPEKWKTADAFNTYGELIGTVKRQQAEFHQRLEGVQRLSEAQLAAQRAELTAKRDDLIDEGGKAKEVKALDKQLQALEQPIVQQTNPILDNWNAENPWINEDSPKAAYAKQVFGQSVASGKSIADAVADVEAGIKKHYPPQARTTTIPESERGAGPKGFNNKPKAVTMDTLTSEEANIWKHSAGMWKNDQKAFLQSVQDSRSAKR